MSDPRPRTISQAMTRFEQRPPKSRKPRADRRNAARHVRNKLPRARIDPVPFTEPLPIPPRTTRRGPRLTPDQQHQMAQVLKRLTAAKAS